MIRVLCLVAPLLLASIAGAEVILTPAEIQKTLRHGPWPTEQAPDPSNQASGDPAAIALGERLFFDPILSKDGSMSCATCHVPALDFTDGMARAMGTQLLDRNTQSLWNLNQHRWFGWAGDTDNLWAQSLTPITNPTEMGHTYDTLQDKLHNSAYYPEYKEIFDTTSDETPETTAVNTAKLLAAYLGTLTTGKTTFDHFRDALETGTETSYPIAAQKGLQIFIGKGNCTFCHSGPNFTNGEFHDAGVPYFIEEGRVDQGRYAGLRALQDSPFTLAGDYSDDPQKTGAWAVNSVRFLHSDFGTFRVPSLRRISHTAPYMHDGSLADLDAVIAHYDDINMERLHSDGEAILKPLNLTTEERANLRLFLETLSDD